MSRLLIVRDCLNFYHQLYDLQTIVNRSLTTLRWNGGDMQQCGDFAESEYLQGCNVNYKG